MTFSPLKTPSPWRKLALGTWHKPGDPTVYGTMPVECSAILKYLEVINQTSSTKITITHFIAKALAMALKKYPDINGIIKWGKIYLRDSVDIFLQVSVAEKTKDDKPNLSGAKICGCDLKSLVEIANELKSRSEKIRNQGDSQYAKSQSALVNLPSWVLGPLMKIIPFLTFNLGLNIPQLGLPQDPFGSAMITSVGSWGVPPGYAPLVPFSRVPLLICIGAVEDRPCAEQGQVVIKPFVDLKITFDHRFMDGLTASRMYKYLLDIFKDPSKHMAV